MAAIAFVVTRENTSAAERVAAKVDTLLHHQYVTMAMRTSLRAPDGTVHYTNSTAELDLQQDRAHVALPDVVRHGSLELVSQGLTLYVVIPADLAGSLGPARWLRVDAASRADARGAHVGPVPDPTTVLLSLAGAEGSVRREGATQRVTIRPRLMAQRRPRDDVASANRLGGLSRQWVATVWSSAAGEPRRILLTSRIREDGKPAGELRFDLRITLDEPVTIGIPPKAATEPVPSVHAALLLLDAA